MREKERGLAMTVRIAQKVVAASQKATSLLMGGMQAFSLPECREERRKSSFYQL
jgi:hypothetical protein